jgi:hypothetical protein
MIPMPTSLILRTYMVCHYHRLRRRTSPHQAREILVYPVPHVLQTHWFTRSIMSKFGIGGQRGWEEPNQQCRPRYILVSICCLDMMHCTILIILFWHFQSFMICVFEFAIDKGPFFLKKKGDLPTLAARWEGSKGMYHAIRLEQNRWLKIKNNLAHV